MALKNFMNLISRWSILKVLRTHIRRITPMYSGRRNLKMQVLETERLVLRKLDRGDLRDIIAWDDGPSAQDTEGQAQEFLNYCFREYRERGIGPWGIQLKETGAIIGNCGFPDIIFNKLCGEVNYYVASHYRGRGLAPEALRVLLEFGFREIGLTRIQARCEPDNLSSERVMQKAGMRFEGLIEYAPSSKNQSPKQKLYAILGKELNLADTCARNDVNVTAKSDPRGSSSPDLPLGPRS
jgi:[ribosomal protein S5]-alanine N-acetyltransferase